MTGSRSFARAAGVQTLIFPPVDPGVGTGAFLERYRKAVPLQHLDGGLAVRDQEVFRARAEPDRSEASFQFRIFQHSQMVLLPSGGVSAEDSRTEHANR